MKRLIIVFAVAPLVLSVATTAIINATYGNIGAAAVPFVLAAYALGLIIWGVVQLVLPGQLCFLTAVRAVAVCVAGGLLGSNLLGWLLITAIGGLVLTTPAAWQRGRPEPTDV